MIESEEETRTSDTPSRPATTDSKTTLLNLLSARCVACQCNALSYRKYQGKYIEQSACGVVVEENLVMNVRSPVSTS